MGVKGLWQLIANCGSPVPLESLEQKILAIDVSIWLHQAVRGFKGFRSGSVANVHLLTLFHRICKLLFYRIRPVFVFDGGVPQLKRQVISSRRLRREAAAGKAQKVRDRLLTNLLRSHAVRKALGKKGPAPSLHRVTKPVKRERDLFELPPLAEPLKGTKSQTSDISHDDNGDIDNEDLYCQNLSQKNLHNFEYCDSEFKSLTLETQHEILSELQDTRKQNSWNSINEMPQESNNFSSFQMNRLLKRYKFQKNLDDIRTEIKRINTSEMEASLFGDLEKHVSLTHKIISEDSTHSILIKNTKESLSEENKLTPPISKGTKSEMKKDFLTELAKQGIVSSSFNKCENQEQSISDNSDDSLSDDECSQSSGKLKKMEEAAFLKAVEYVLDDSELTQEEIFSLIEQTKSEVESEPPKRNNKDFEDTLNRPSTSANATGIVYNSDAESSTDDDDFIDVPEMENISQNNTQNSVISAGKDDFVTAPKISEETSTSTNVEKVLGAKTDSLYIKILQQKLEDLIQTSNVKSSVDTRSPKKKNNIEQNMSFSPPKANVTISLNFDDVPALKEDIFRDIFKSNGKSNSNKSTKLGNNKSLQESVMPTSIKKTIKPLSSSTNICNNTGGENEFCPKSSINRDTKIEKSFKNISELPELESNVMETLNFSDCTETQSQESSNMFESIENSNFQDTELTAYSCNTLKTSLKIGTASTNEQANIFQKNTAVSQKKSDSLCANEYVANSLSGKEEKAVEEVTKDELVEGEERESKDSEVIELPLKHSTKDLENLEGQLANEQNSLLSQINQAESVALEISDQVYGEAQELLKLFGLPYLVAPMEAEAQCAFLDIAGLSHGTITNDSDVFLFGGKRVYKNFFNQDKYVECFTFDSIKHNLGLDRNKMISLAMLTGSDYTLGIESVGAVLGMEILSDFPGTGIECLKNFKLWWNKASKIPPSIHASKTRQRISRLSIPEYFPNEDVFKAYLQPDIDDSTEKFSWGLPNLEHLRNFTAEKFGWNQLKTDEIIIPVLKKIGIRETQMRINSYFNNIKLIKEPNYKSKRLQEAIERAKGVPFAESAGTSCSKMNVKKNAQKRSVKLINPDNEICDNIKPVKKKKLSEFLNDSKEDHVEKKKEMPLTKEEKKIQIYRKLQEKEKIAQMEAEKEDKLKKKAIAVKIFSKSKG